MLCRALRWNGDPDDAASQLNPDDGITIFDDLWWPLITFDDLWWPLMSFDDLWWPLMTFDDVWWPLITFNDFWWPLMTFDDLCWPLMTFDDLWWPLMSSGLLPVRQADPGPAGERAAGGQVRQLQGHTQDSGRDIPAGPQPQVSLQFCNHYWLQSRFESYIWSESYHCWNPSSSNVATI